MNTSPYYLSPDAELWYFKSFLETQVPTVVVLGTYQEEV